MSARSLVESFLSLSPLTAAEDLENYCAPTLEFTSPVESTRGLEAFRAMLNRMGNFSQLHLKRVFEDGAEICAIYTKRSGDDELTFTDLFNVRDGKIARIESNFNAKPILDRLAEI